MGRIRRLLPAGADGGNPGRARVARSGADCEPSEPLKVFVAGATGALGRPLVQQLVARGHHVVGTTRHSDRADMLRGQGAEPVVVDALDRTVVLRAVASAGPDVVVQALTTIPARGPWRYRDLDATDRIRREGGAHLLAAARRADVRRYVAESIAFVYGYVGGAATALTEDARLAPPGQPVGRLQRVAATVVHHERQLLAAREVGGLEVVVLRFGAYSGPSSAAFERLARDLRRRMVPMPGGGPGVVPWTHLDDAAAAIVAAVEAPQPGPVYNVVDDDRGSFGEFIGTYADLLGAPRPLSVPVSVGRLVAPYMTAMAALSNLVVSNALAKRELRWQPRHPERRSGLEHLVDALSLNADGRRHG